jgi:uncharacterized protein (TIGR02147 family)
MNKIFEYLEYREFLRDFYEEKKKESPFFSYKLFGRKVGIDQSYLAKVLIKSRHIADSSIKRFIEYFQFNKSEGEYFETLVHFVKAKSDKQSKLYFEKLLSFKEVRTTRIAKHQYEFYKKWYYSAVRSLLEYYDFKGDYKELAEKLDPPISVKEAKQSIRLLERLQLIKKDPDGRYILVDKAITTGEEWRSLAIKSFQEEAIKLANESLTRHNKDLRDISTITMNINPENLIEIRERIKEFRNSLIQYVDSCTSPESVYQMNFQLFPLTKINRKKQ